MANPQRKTLAVFREVEPPVVFQDQQTLTSAELPEFSATVDRFIESVGSTSRRTAGASPVTAMAAKGPSPGSLRIHPATAAW